MEKSQRSAPLWRVENSRFAGTCPFIHPTAMAHDAKPKAESEDQNLGKTKKALDNDSDYDSAEDDDFQEDDAISNESSDEEAGPSRKKGKKEDLDSGDEVTIVKAKKKRKGVEQEGQEDLILTRSQKRAKYLTSLFRLTLTFRAEEGKAAPQAPLKQDKPEDLDALWKQLNDKKSGDHASTSSQVKLQSDTIKIKRTYEFAGQVVTYYILCYDY